jgi:predicted DNA-binding transcriptional regulator YafY
VDESISVPEGFDIDQLIDSGHFGFGPGVKIVVDLLFQPGYGEHLIETPLSLDQQITYTPEQRLRVTSTIADTPQLRWWILGFGEGVEVINPGELRHSIATAANEMLARYEN